MAQEEILIVDDSCSSLMWLSELMSSMNYKVTCAKNAHDALSILDNSNPDLILLDVDMPEMSGLELCVLIKKQERFKDVPILFQSVLADSNIRIEGLTAGAADFLSKPYNPDEILLRVGIHLKLHALQTNLEETVAKRTEQLVTEIAERKSIETDLLQSKKQLRQLAEHLQDVREEERRRIAREIHDELGQTLSLANIELKTITTLLSAVGGVNTKLRSVLQRLDYSLKKSAETARSISENLRPGMLDTLGLKPALEFHIANFAKTTQLACNTEIRLDNQADIDSHHATVVFRVIQESLTNIAKHANARSVSIHVIGTEEWLLVIIQDDGVGIQNSGGPRKDSFGLIGMAERAEMLGGELVVETSKGGGTKIEVFLPLNSTHKCNARP
jgi:signal transduction histidine kinase